MKALFTAFDLLQIVLAFVIMFLGLSRRWSIWREKRPAAISGDWPGLGGYLLGHGKILNRQSVGLYHLAVFWGVVLPLMVILVAQFGFTLPSPLARLLSLIQDLAGLALLAGTLLLMFRRLGLAEDQGPSRTLLPMVLLLVIVLSGFLAEGARLRILYTGSQPWSSPIGGLFAWISPASPLFMQMMIRLHFVAVLVFIAAIPFTFMRHILASPLNVVYRKQGPPAALTHLDMDQGQIGAEKVKDLSWKQLLDAEACVACGRCDENCPALISGKPLSPRNIIRSIRKQMEAADRPLLAAAISSDEMWACTTCMACVAHCPLFVEPMDKIIDIRRFQVMGEAQLPAEAQPMIRDLNLYGDVQGKGAAHRANWAMNRDVLQLSDASSAVDILFWVGCSGAFHPRNRETSQALVKILQSAGVRFAILGTKEMCCGDPARRLGDEILFRKLAQANLEILNRYQAKKIVTLCPHCLNTLKNEYPEMGCKPEVVHASQLVNELIHEGRITLKYPVADRMTIHDACYLGRYNQVYHPPREICQAVPASQFSETVRNRESGLCCGGGGGRMWLHENIGENINRVRAAELAETGADLIGTACPYCLVMLDDGVKSLELEKTPKVMDIIDIVADAMG